MFNRLAFLTPVLLLLACTAHAKTWTLKGQIARWPAGKTGTLKMYPGEALRYIPVGAAALLEARIDPTGHFLLNLPDHKLNAALTKASLLLGDPANCQHQKKSRAVRVVPMTLVIFNSKGQHADNLEIRLPQRPPQTLTVFYAAQTTHLSAVCGVARSMVLNVQIKAGWNLLSSQQNTRGVLVNSVQQLPEDVIWQPVLNLKDL